MALEAEKGIYSYVLYLFNFHDRADRNGRWDRGAQIHTIS